MSRQDRADEEGDRRFHELREDGEKTRFCPSCNLIVTSCRHQDTKPSHVCQAPDYCFCSSIGLEPAEDCPIHSSNFWHFRCGTCGRFIKRKKEEP